MNATEYKTIDDGSGGGVPVVRFDTAKTLLIPVYLYEKGIWEDYLHLNGMGLSTGETAVASEPQDDMVAVMAVASDTLALVRRELGDNVRFSTPLLEIAGGRKRDVNICLTDKNAYLAVWEKGLRMAEALPDNSVDSLLYYMQVLGRRFKLRKFDIHVGGLHAETAAKALGKYFSNVKISKRLFE